MYVFMCMHVFTGSLALAGSLLERAQFYTGLVAEREWGARRFQAEAANRYSRRTWRLSNALFFVLFSPKF